MKLCTHHSYHYIALALVFRIGVASQSDGGIIVHMHIEVTQLICLRLLNVFHTDYICQGTVNTTYPTSLGDSAMTLGLACNPYCSVGAFWSGIFNKFLWGTRLGGKSVVHQSLPSGGSC